MLPLQAKFSAEDAANYIISQVQRHGQGVFFGSKRTFRRKAERIAELLRASGLTVDVHGHSEKPEYNSPLYSEFRTILAVGDGVTTVESAGWFE